MFTPGPRAATPAALAPTPVASPADAAGSLVPWYMKPEATLSCSMARRPLDPDVEKASWGWAAQQCLEKTLKAWLYITGVKPPTTHDISDLSPLRAFTTFAVQYRYDDQPEELSLDRSAWCKRAKALIDQVQEQNG